MSESLVAKRVVWVIGWNGFYVSVKSLLQRCEIDDVDAVHLKNDEVVWSMISDSAAQCDLVLVNGHSRRKTNLFYQLSRERSVPIFEWVRPTTFIGCAPRKQAYAKLFVRPDDDLLLITALQQILKPR